MKKSIRKAFKLAASKAGGKELVDLSLFQNRHNERIKQTNGWSKSVYRTSGVDLTFMVLVEESI